MALRDLDRIDRRIRHGVWVLAAICLVLAIVVWGRLLGMLPQ